MYSSVTTDRTATILADDGSRSYPKRPKSCSKTRFGNSWSGPKNNTPNDLRKTTQQQKTRAQWIVNHQAQIQHPEMATIIEFWHKNSIDAIKEYQ